MTAAAGDDRVMLQLLLCPQASCCEPLFSDPRVDGSPQDCIVLLDVRCEYFDTTCNSGGVACPSLQ